MTVDQQGQIVPNGIIEKERVADLNVHAPNQPLDFRISINVEHPRKLKSFISTLDIYIISL